MRIAVLDDYQDNVRTLACFGMVAAHDVTIWNDHMTDDDVLGERLKETEALVLIRERTPIRAPLLERLDRLRLISQFGVCPHIDLEACTRRGVIVSSSMASAQPSYATAELTWGLIIGAMRRIPQEAAALKAGRWQAFPVGAGLRGKTLGVCGYGRIGAVVAGYGKAFAMSVLAWGGAGSLERARADGCATAASKAELFEASDVLTLHVALTDATRGLVTAADLARMKPTALLVNTSRAGLVERGALEAALAAGRPGMAAVDVYEDEPVLGARHPLLARDDVVCTPHLGYVERDQLEIMFGRILEQILAYAKGAPISVVNPAAMAAR